MAVTVWIFTIVTLLALSTGTNGNNIESIPSIIVTERTPLEIACNADISTKLEGLRFKQIGKGGKDMTIVDLLAPEYTPAMRATDPERYTVTKNGLTNFVVSLKEATFEDAKRYRCSLIVNDGVTQGNSVVVIRKPDIIPLGTIKAGEQAAVECEFQYAIPHDLDETAEAGLIPQISASLGGVALPAQPTRVDGKISVRLNGTIQEEDDGKDFVCRAFTTNPAFEVTSSMRLEVPMAVRDIKIDPIRPTYQIGDKINCTAKGNPQPSITWKPMKSQVMVNVGSQLVIVNSMGAEEVWKCVATNLVSGTDLNRIEQTINFTIFRPTLPPVGEQKEMPVAAIAAGVAVPVVLLVMIVIVICVIITKKKKNKKTAYTPNDPVTTIRPMAVVSIEDSISPDNNNANSSSSKPQPSTRKPKPNTSGHNVSFSELQKEEEKNQEASAEPLLKDGKANNDAEKANEGVTGGNKDKPRLADIANQAAARVQSRDDETDISYNVPKQRTPIVATEYPDIVSAHPGLQQAYSKPKPKPLPRARPPADTTV